METIIFDRWWTSHQSLAREFLRIFRICVMPWNMSENPQSNTVWEDKLTWFKSSPQYRTLDTIDGEPWKSSGIFSWDSPHCSSATKSRSSCRKLAKSQKNSQDGSSSCRCSTTSHGDLKTMNRNAMLTPTSFQNMQKDFSPGRWSFLGPGSEKKWCSTHIDRPQGEWDRVAELMMIKFAESGHPVFRATSPLSRGTLKSKGGGKLSMHFCADGDTIETVFRTIVCVNQLSIYAAVSNLCKECKTCHVTTGRLVLAGQSDPLFVPSVMKTHTHTHTFDRWSCARRRSIAKIPRTSWKAFTTIVWLNFVLMQDSWQQLRSDSTSWQKTLKNSHNSQIQWLVVSTLCQKMKHHLTQKVGFEGIPKLGPYWKLQPVAYKVNMEWKIRIESVNKDNAHSWVRISHGLNKIGHELEQQQGWPQRAGNLSDAVRRLCVEKTCTCFC